MPRHTAAVEEPREGPERKEPAMAGPGMGRGVPEEQGPVSHLPTLP